MRITNNTKHRVPNKWIQKFLDHLGVNPEITLLCSDNPEEVKTPNYKVKFGRKFRTLDGLATDNNRVYIYVGSWKDGKYLDYSTRYVKWLLLHELRHQYYFYHYGNTKDPWKGKSKAERERREERACNRFANLIVGVPSKDFRVMKKDAKRKVGFTGKAKRKRYI